MLNHLQNLPPVNQSVRRSLTLSDLYSVCDRSWPQVISFQTLNFQVINFRGFGLVAGWSGRESGSWFDQPILCHSPLSRVRQTIRLAGSNQYTAVKRRATTYFQFIQWHNCASGSGTMQVVQGEPSQIGNRQFCQFDGDQICQIISEEISFFWDGH